jgi:hypothetical protein
MAFLSREFVAVPDDRKDQIVFKWPDHNLRKGTRAIVEPDMMAVFISRGSCGGHSASVFTWWGPIARLRKGHPLVSPWRWTVARGLTQSRR